MILLTAVTALTWLAYSGPHAPDRPGLPPFLLLIAVLTQLFPRLLRATPASDPTRYSAIAGVAWFALYPAHADVLSDPVQAPLLWMLATIALATLPLPQFPKWRSYGLFLAAPVAAAIWYGPLIVAIAPWKEHRGFEHWVASLVAAGVALAAWRWNALVHGDARPLSISLGWFSLAIAVFPTATLPALAGLALAGSWLASLAIQQLSTRGKQVLAAGFVGVLLFYAAQITQHGITEFTAVDPPPLEAPEDQRAR